MYSCIKTAIPGPKSAALINEWHKHEAFACGYQASVVWEKGEDCIVTDVDGNKFIDWTSGVLVTSVGHCHPKLVKAVQTSVAKLINNYECPTEYRVNAARDLMAVAPKQMGKCFFFTTGAEATETAIRMMKRRSGKFEILCFECGFHGKTSGSASAGGLAMNWLNRRAVLIRDAFALARVPSPDALLRVLLSDFRDSPFPCTLSWWQLPLSDTPSPATRLRRASSIPPASAPAQPTTKDNQP